jgi:hypothetical protein
MAPALDLEPDVEPEAVPEGGVELEVDKPGVPEDCDEEGPLPTVEIGTAVDSGLSVGQGFQSDYALKCWGTNLRQLEHPLHSMCR